MVSNWGIANESSVKYDPWLSGALYTGVSIGPVCMVNGKETNVSVYRIIARKSNGANVLVTHATIELYNF